MVRSQSPSAFSVLLSCSTPIGIGNHDQSINTGSKALALVEGHNEEMRATAPDGIMTLNCSVALNDGFAGSFLKAALSVPDMRLKPLRLSLDLHQPVVTRMSANRRNAVSWVPPLWISRRLQGNRRAETQ